MIRKIYFLFINLLLFTGIIPAQQLNNKNNLKFKNISLQDGLSQSSVLCVLQDKNGFIWFGTRDGLNKYDGNSFKIYRYNSIDSTSISNSYIKALHEDKDGNLWIGTTHGLNKFNRKEDNFERYIFKDTANSYQDEIWDIENDGASHLIIATNNGLHRFNIKENVYEQNSGLEELLSGYNNFIRALYITSNGGLWIKNVGNILFVNTARNQIEEYQMPDGTGLKKNTHSKSCIFEDNAGNIWLGYNKGLALLNTSNNKFESYKLPDSDQPAITNSVRSIYQDDSGVLWIGTYHGLYLLDVKHKLLSHFSHNDNNPNSLAQNSIYSIYGDFKGDIWIGTYAGGISYYNKNFDLFRHFSPGINNSKLNYKVVSGIIENPNGDLWIGTEGGGVNYYYAHSGKYTYFTQNKKNPGSLSANNVKALLRDRSGNIWIGTHDAGLNFLNPSLKPYNFKKFRHHPNDTNSISDDRVIALYEFTNGNIYIGTSGGGLNILEPHSERLIRVSDPKKICGDIVYTIDRGPTPNKLLVGGENGLGMIDVYTHEIQPISFRKPMPNRVITGGVLCTFIDKKNNIWIGTEGDGLYQFNPKKGTSIRYGTAEGLPNEVIYGILTDDLGHLWLSTNLGLSRLNLSTETFKNFDASDGLQANEFNYGACFKNDKGELYFGGVNGFNRFNPKRITSNTYIPPVAITSFKVNNKPYLHLLDSEKKIILDHDQNVLHFDFVALSYSQPDKNQYAFMMEGFDTDYNLVGNQKTATYTNLDAGTYRFNVKGSNNDGLWNNEGDSITITIRPLPWKTWWAYSLYFLAGATILLIIRKYSLQRIRDRNELKNERLEKQRITEVNQLKLELFTNISHDFRTPLTLIMGPLERMIKNGRGNNYVQKQHQNMHRNASVLMELINQLLDFRKTESGNMKVKATMENVVPFVREVKLAFEDLAKSKKIQYNFSASSEDISMWFDKIMLKKILYNLISNAFKFTPENGLIGITIKSVKRPVKSMPKGYVKISVTDTGKGIPKDKINFIFERFYTYGERFGTGIGLALTRSLVELHKGIIKVQPNAIKGTTFNVYLPLGSHHLSEEEKVTDDNNISINENIFIASPTPLGAIEHKEFNGFPNTAFRENLPSVLIVEDNAEVRQFIKETFNENYNVFEAPNGLIALNIAKTSPIDIIISDVMMPVMDGMEMCHQIKSDITTSHIPVILLTAHTSEAHQKSGYKTGADAYITKPFDVEILAIRVNNLIHSRQLLIEKFKKDIILNPKDITATSTDEEFLQKAIHLVEENITNTDFTTAVFVEKMFMSRSALYRKLKLLTGQSISEFIRIVKLKRAAQLTAKTDMNISEIAFELGFNDLKYFRKIFKEQFKKTPSKYREEHRTNSF